jgi:hypothetical protein
VVLISTYPTSLCQLVLAASCRPVSSSSSSSSSSSLLFSPTSHIIIDEQRAQRPWNSIMLVVGEWNVRLRGPCWMDVSRLFPTVIDSTEMKESNAIEGWNVIPIRRRLWGATLDCRLSMAEDGTFVLMPHTTTSKTGGEIGRGPRRLITTSSQQPQQQQLSSIMPLRGEWKVSSNPYCLTDRYYDQLSLQTYPRTLQQLHESSPLHANIQIQDDAQHVRSRPVKVPTCNTTTVTTIDFTLHGRLWGLYDRPRQPRRQRRPVTTIPSPSSNNDDDYDVTNNTIADAVSHAPKLYGRMTHGTLVLRRRRRQQQPQQQQWHRQSCTTDQKDGDSRSTSHHCYQYYRPIIASFSAQRSSTDPIHDGWIDQAYFGY